MGIIGWNENKSMIVSPGKHYDLKSILDNVECYKDNPRYESYKEKLEMLIEASQEHINPTGYIVKSARDRYLPASSLYSIYCMVTLGPWIDGQIQKHFANYEYLEGMMLNALGDQILYEATNELYEMVKEDVTIEGKFLTIRYEPGNSEIPMEKQKEIFEIINENYELEMYVTEGYMLSPTKSLAYFYGVEADDCSLGIDHDCSSCQSTECKMRKYLIKIHINGEVNLIQAKKGENLLDVLRRHKVFLESPCSGKRLCGKCKVHVPKHGYEMDLTEARFLSQDEIENNIILACYHTVDRNLEVKLDINVMELNISVDYAPFTIKSPRYEKNDYEIKHRKLGVGIDIGTTTVAISLVDLVSHEVLDTKKILNPQKAYGADIISRIQYVAENPNHMLTTLIRECLQENIIELFEQGEYEFAQLSEIVVAGNTTMIYLLLDIDPKELAVSPFTTIDMGLYKCSSDEFWKLPVRCSVTILPWVSAYIGVDIVSGIFATHLKDKKENILFIDIGTNGEIVLKHGDRMTCVATAAGPAFEGANIKCGMGSIGGAICEIIQSDIGYELEVYGHGEPMGLCGSALIDAIAILLKNGHILDTGYMEAPYMFHKEIGIYPDDVRQVQLAKAAIAAGIEVLLEVSGLSCDEVDYVYLAGGFGSHLNVRNAAAIGLIPVEFESKVIVVGNTSLAGSIRYLLEKHGQTEIETILSSCDYLELSSNMIFNNAYVNNMMFGGLL
jgi:uncharacterized 2Fe-2S/4Fe-4S cluster protein (DUF4445 family)